MITGDSTEYDLLTKWTETLPFFENPKSVVTCEIGVRKGLGSKSIIDAMRKRIGKDVHYEHIGIDPYGDLNYQHFDEEIQNQLKWKDKDGNESPTPPTYPDSMRIEMLNDFSSFKEFNFYHMTDIRFMKFFTTEDKIYDLVHFDGEHTTQSVLRAAIWFADRSRKGTRFIFDDYKHYFMEDISKALTHFGFNILDNGTNKLMLQKLK